MLAPENRVVIPEPPRETFSRPMGDSNSVREEIASKQHEASTPGLNDAWLRFGGRMKFEFTAVAGPPVLVQVQDERDFAVALPAVLIDVDVVSAPLGIKGDMGLEPAKRQAQFATQGLSQIIEGREHVLNAGIRVAGLQPRNQIAADVDLGLGRRPASNAGGFEGLGMPIDPRRPGSPFFVGNRLVGDDPAGAGEILELNA